ncbi:MAG: KH domain-containing protein [Candidatus Marinimicrobia bacterium]|jgi:hypothetical protein|nr:KH domain-containing protein [Candidatus Neomarinimicrobiota bacterium]OQC48400.1 MAG: hypothetical protein BWX60_00025 [Candidatus Marinimicrobia bacterium ADurb.Bin030]NLA22143.1 KH domain-containing protein [Candidatus Neomarinimicrobiota bacterium]HNZ37117.1 KH domain-containing protein [Candidatus Neomarinimicrobiota bacterium]HOD37416.1 KH domain-containing protein [Candidatus Neomarinimicrobiota bacterium]
MKEFVEFIVKQLVDHPEDVKVVQVDSEKTVILELSVKEGDLGKVIGKKGRTARAIRTLLTAAAAKQGQKRAILEIIE